MASIDQLEQFLAGGGPEIAERWSQWLQLPQLKAELERAELRRDASDEAVLQQILDRYYRNEAGLELPALVAVRQELRGYLESFWSDVLNAYGAEIARRLGPARNRRRK